MTNERVGSFVSDLVEMAKAVEQVPVLERELQDAGSVINSLQQTRSDLEVSLEASRRYAATLEQRCHDLEVQRDAAELRFLESDDAVGTLKRAMRIAMGEVDSALQAVEPPKPEPVPEPMATNVDFPLTDGPLLYAGGGDGSFNENDGPLAPLDDDRMSPNYRGTEVSEVPVDPIAPWHSGNESETVQHAVESVTVEPSSNAEEAPADATTGPIAPLSQPVSSETVGTAETTDGAKTTYDGVSVPPSPTASSSPTPTSPNAPPVETSEGAASDSDLEPIKYDYYGNVRQAWLEWYSRQRWQNPSA